MDAATILRSTYCKVPGSTHVCKVSSLGKNYLGIGTRARKPKGGDPRPP